MFISQFEASEKFTSLTFGSSSEKALSTLFDHVKDDAIHLDQTGRLLQTVTHHAHGAIATLKGSVTSFGSRHAPS